jgi:ATP-dependent Clp protease ATP-binding subunit ClpB
MEKHSVSRLMGAPPGYVGYEEGGQLTEKIRRRPYAVVLFDEIEKAHPEVFNILLQILEDGRLTNGQGRVVNFKNTIIIMTSNIASQYFTHASYTKQQLRENIEKALKEQFRPEFLNRIDEIIIFNRLNKQDLGKIVELQLNELRAKVKARGISIKVDPKAQAKIAEEGYDQDFGARPLKRYIQRHIQDILAVKLLNGEFKNDDEIVIGVDDKKESFIFKSN